MPLGSNYLGSAYLGSSLVFVPTKFTPPIVYDRPPYNDDSTEMQKALFKYMTPLNGRYVSVFRLSDGTFVQDTPTTENSNTNVPYPWDPNNPSAPYAVADYWDVSQSPAKYTVDATSHSVWVVKVYNGVTVVDQSEIDMLILNGYRNCLS